MLPTTALKAITINIKFVIIKATAFLVRILSCRIFFIEMLGVIKGLATLCMRIPEWPKITGFARRIGRHESASLIVLKYYLQKGIDQIWESVLYEIPSLKKYIIIENRDLLEKAKKKGNGTIILGAHYGPGLYLYTLSQLAKDIKGLVDPSTCRYTEDGMKFGLRPLISKMYLFQGEAERCLPARSKERALVSHIRNNGVILTHIDASGPNPAAGAITLFGRALRIQSFPFKLALKYHCTVLFCSFVKGTGEHAYRLRLVASPEFTTPVEGFSRYLDFIRAQIESYPFMWTYLPDFSKVSEPILIDPEIQ